MPVNSEFSMQPDEVTDAAGRLDALADRIDKTILNETSNLTVVAAGRDEVSERVAATLNDVQVDFVKSLRQGLTEVREISATLRAHTQRVIDAEREFVV